MSCSTCTRTNDVPLNFGNLTIGTVGSNSTAYYVYMKHMGTGITTKYNVTSSGSGVIDLSRSGDAVRISPGLYEIRATLATSTDIETNATITISAVDYTCFLVRFIDVVGYLYGQTGYDNISLKV